MTVTPLLELALTNTILASALALVVWIVTRFVRNPHVAHLLWCVVLLKLVTPPLIAVPIALPADAETGPSQTLASQSDSQATLATPSPVPATFVNQSVVEKTTPVSASAITENQAALANVDGSGWLGSGRRSDALNHPQPSTDDLPPAGERGNLAAPWGRVDDESVTNNRGQIATTRPQPPVAGVMEPVVLASSPPPSILSSQPDTNAPAPASWQSLLTRWPIALAGIWLAGSLAVAVVMLWRMRSFSRQLRPLITRDDELEAATARAARKVGLSVAPEVRFVAAPLGPLVWAGRRKPLVIVPRALWEMLTPPQRQTLLMHELAHLLRRDHWIRRGEAALVVLYWWLPTLWWAIRRREAATEACCDALVLNNSTEHSTAYAEALLQAVELSSAHSPALLSQGLGRTSHLKARLTMIVRNYAPKRLGWFAWLLLVGLSVGLLGLSAELVQADGNDDKQATGEDSAAAKSDNPKPGDHAQGKRIRPGGPGHFGFGFGKGGFGKGKFGPGAFPKGGQFPKGGKFPMAGIAGFGFPGGGGMMPGMPGEMMPGAGMMPGMPGGGGFGARAFGPMTRKAHAGSSPNISSKVRQKMRERLMAIATDDEESLKVRLSALEAATSAGLAIGSSEHKEELEAMLWKAVHASEDAYIQKRAVAILAERGSTPATVDDVVFLAKLLEKPWTGRGMGGMGMGMGGMGTGMGGMGTGPTWSEIGPLLKNLTHSASGLSRLIGAIQQIESKKAEANGDDPPKTGGRAAGAKVVPAGPAAGARVMLAGPQSTATDYLLYVLERAVPQDDASVKVLLKALEHENPEIRAAAISALGNLQSKREPAQK